MTIITDFGNFGNPRDLNHYMANENIKDVELICDYWGTRFGKIKLTKDEVEKWADGKDMVTGRPIEDFL